MPTRSLLLLCVGSKAAFGRDPGIALILWPCFSRTRQTYHSPPRAMKPPELPELLLCLLPKLADISLSQKPAAMPAAPPSYRQEIENRRNLFSEDSDRVETRCIGCELHPSRFSCGMTSILADAHLLPAEHPSSSEYLLLAVRFKGGAAVACRVPVIAQIL